MLTGTLLLITHVKVLTMNKITLSLLISLLTFLSLTVQAERQLTIVTDQGGDSALTYYESLNMQDNSRPVTKIPAPIIRHIDETSSLPIVSAKLSPGKIEARVINANGLIRPFFMVGDDELSINWLKQRAPYLEKLQAVGLVVNVKDADSFNTLKSLVPSLTVLPVSGDDIATRLNLAHYPVLVTATAIEQ